MEIIMADSYGFCFGIKRATEGVYAAAKSTSTVTLGPVTHNKFVLQDMAKSGVKIAEDMKELELIADKNDTVIIRAHGVAPYVYEELEQKGFNYVDLTCPCVKANQILAKRAYEKGKTVIITGDKNHPEVVGINGQIFDNAIVIGKPEEIEGIDFSDNLEYYLMSQTTFSTLTFDKILDILKQKIKNLDVKNTICDDTLTKQNAVKELAKKVDKMVVIGDKTSSNSKKLYEISKAIQKNTYFIESISDLDLKIFSVYDKIGVTAGASTPPAIIKEAVELMSEIDKNPKDSIENEQVVEQNERFEDMLEESILTLHTGDMVKGKVISVINGEVMVNLGFKSDGVIQRGQFSDDADIDPNKVVSEGDEIDVYVLRVNDGDGNVLLSKKRIDAQKGYIEIEEAYKNKTTLKGKIIEPSNKGVIASILGIRVFVPASQISNRFIKNLEGVVGQEHMFNILEFERNRRGYRVLAGRRELAMEQEAAERKALLSKVSVGDKVKGKVSNITDFGAFIDLGGIDGLAHITELSYKRVRSVGDILKKDDVVEAYILKIDKEKGKISLTLKSVENDPWNNVEEKYPVGEVVTGCVVRLVDFGAFIELEEGLDGLVHVSQISKQHIAKPSDALSIGQEIEVKVVGINHEKRNVSLSIKEVFEDDYDDNYDDYEYEDDFLETDDSTDASQELNLLDANDDASEEE